MHNKTAPSEKLAIISKFSQATARLHAILTNPLTPDIFYQFVQGNNAGDEKTAYQFLSKYADFCGKDSPFAVSLREHIRQAFEEPEIKAVNAYKNAIVTIPPSPRHR